MLKRDRGREFSHLLAFLRVWLLGLFFVLCCVRATKVTAEDGLSVATPPKSKYADLMFKGHTLGYLPVESTADGDHPIRAWLADHGIGYYGWVISQFGSNLLDVARSAPDGSQRYFGQRPTALVSLNGSLIFDLSRYGIENGQFTIIGRTAHATWDQAGPPQTNVSVINYYQTLFDKRIEFRIGYIGNDYEFYGPYVGGNLAASIFGASSTVTREMGLSSGAASRPSVNVTFNAGYFYDKMTVQLSTSPDGYAQERKENPSFLGWNTKHAGVLFVNEVGYRQPPTATTHWRWLRFGYMRNTSDYRDYKFGNGIERSNNNYAFYFVGDSQVIKFQGGAPSRGINAGFAANLGLDRYLPIAQTYEARIFTTGPFKNRPGDMFSLILTDSIFSKYAVRLAEQAGAHPVPSSWTLTGAASVEVGPGAFAGLGLAYTDKPVPIASTPGTGHSLQLLANFALFY